MATLYDTKQEACTVGSIRRERADAIRKMPVAFSAEMEPVLDEEFGNAPRPSRLGADRIGCRWPGARGKMRFNSWGKTIRSAKLAAETTSELTKPAVEGRVGGKLRSRVFQSRIVERR